MTLRVLLDAGPLGLVTNPRGSGDADQCNRWLESLLAAGIDVWIPEIADYEVRRELLRADTDQGLARLDALQHVLGYLPITTATMRQAAIFWAQARKRGRPTADDKALDGDVILAAQAVLAAGGEHESMIATTNVAHLSLFTQARLWHEIAPDADQG